MKKIWFVCIGIVLVLAVMATVMTLNKRESMPAIQKLVQQTMRLPSPTATEVPLPTTKTLSNEYHVYQSFNNCGPASLSMTLSYYGIHKTQDELGREIRPYQNPQGDNDDKSVTLDELAAKGEELGLLSYHRPNGSIDLLKRFIAADIPVLTRTWLKTDEDIGHYRVVKGYDGLSREIVQDDSFQGPNRRYSYADFNTMWEKFSYEYLVFAPPQKREEVERIMGEDLDERGAWTRAAEQSRVKLNGDPDNIYHRFNLSVALYHAGDAKGSVTEFEKVEEQLPKRTLWYQIEPIQAYMALEDYDRVLSMTDYILSHDNRAFSELYIMRGDIFLKRGDKNSARSEYEKAVMYNSYLQDAKDRLYQLES